MINRLAVFYGGPEDGRVMGNIQTERVHFPVTSKSVRHWLEREPMAAPPPKVMNAEYVRAYADGHPVLDDEGRERFEFAGMVP